MLAFGLSATRKGCSFTSSAAPLQRVPNLPDYQLFMNASGRITDAHESEGKSLGERSYRDLSYNNEGRLQKNGIGTVLLVCLAGAVIEGLSTELEEKVSEDILFEKGIDDAILHWSIKLTIPSIRKQCAKSIARDPESPYKNLLRSMILNRQLPAKTAELLLFDIIDQLTSEKAYKDSDKNIASWLFLLDDIHHPLHREFLDTLVVNGSMTTILGKKWYDMAQPHIPGKLRSQLNESERGREFLKSLG